MITAQCLLICAVIQDGIKRTCKSLLFLNTFLDLFETLEYIGDALVAAAEHNEAVSVIHHHLHTDHMYNINMSCIVSKIIHFDYEDCWLPSQPRTHIPLFRREVKDLCVAIVQAEFLAIPTNLGVVNLVLLRASHKTSYRCACILIIISRLSMWSVICSSQVETRPSATVFVVSSQSVRTRMG